IPAERDCVDLVLEFGGNGPRAVVGCAVALSVRLLGADDVGVDTTALLQHAAIRGEPERRSAHPQQSAGIGDDATRSRRAGWRLWPLACGRRRGDAMARRLYSRLPLSRAKAGLCRAARAYGAGVRRAPSRRAAERLRLGELPI